MNEKLVKIIQENPDLDIVVMASTDEFTDEYGSILLEKLNVEVMDIYESPTSDYIFFDEYDVIDELREALADDNGDLNEEEYEKLCEEKAKDYFYKKAIVIWASN